MPVITRINFLVVGEARPAGSKQAFPFRKQNGSLGVRVAHDNPHTKDWMSQVAEAARKAYNGPLLDGPIRLELSFKRPRPKGHYGRHGVRLSAPAYPTTRPDTVKLTRAVEDALTGVLWRDDSQVVEHLLFKAWGEFYGVYVTVEELL